MKGESSEQFAGLSTCASRSATRVALILPVRIRVRLQAHHNALLTWVAFRRCFRAYMEIPLAAIKKQVLRFAQDDNFGKLTIFGRDNSF
jgi:hypothetical protein